MLEHFRYHPVDEGSDERLLSRSIRPLKSKDALARAQEPKVLLRYGFLQPFYRFIEDPESLSRSIVGSMDGPRKIPQAWLGDPPRFGDEWTER